MSLIPAPDFDTLRPRVMAGVHYCSWLVLPARIGRNRLGYRLLVPNVAGFQRTLSPLKLEENTLFLLQTCELRLTIQSVPAPRISRGLETFSCISDCFKHIHSPDAVYEHPGDLVQTHASFKRRILLIRVNNHCRDT